MARTSDRFFSDSQDGVLADRDRSLLERMYVSQVLDEEGSWVLEEQQKVIKEFQLNRSGLMAESRRLRVRGLSDKEQMGMELSMVKYLRFQDIAGSKGTILGTEEATKKRKRQYHLYNRIVFAGYNKIINRLRFGFVEEVQAELREQAIKAGLLKTEL